MLGALCPPLDCSPSKDNKSGGGAEILPLLLEPSAFLSLFLTQMMKFWAVLPQPVVIPCMSACSWAARSSNTRGTLQDVPPQGLF